MRRGLWCLMGRDTVAVTGSARWRHQPRGGHCPGQWPFQLLSQPQQNQRTLRGRGALPASLQKNPKGRLPRLLPTAVGPLLGTTDSGA